MAIGENTNNGKKFYIAHKTITSLSWLPSNLLRNFIQMNVKEKIKERVNDISDPQLLNELLRAVDLAHEIEHIDEISEQEKEAIDKGITDAENGNLHSNSEASQLVKKWLNK